MTGKRMFGAALACLLLGTQVGAWGAEGPVVQWRDGALSVSAREVPLNALLSEVAERTGIELSLTGELSEPVSVHFDGVGLRDGLGQILLSGGVSYALVEYHSGDAAQPSIALFVSRRAQGTQAASGAGYLDPVIPPQMLERFKAARDTVPAQAAPLPPGQVPAGMEGVLNPEMLQAFRERMAAARAAQAAQGALGTEAQPPAAKAPPAGGAQPAPSPPAAGAFGGTLPFSMTPFGGAPAPGR